jgi:predicted GH43/DUF377 family glycosyl hydrolase
VAAAHQGGWEKHEGNPLLQDLFVGSVTFDGTTYSMWTDTLEGIKLYTSTDGIAWSEHPANPVLGFGDPGSWDEAMVFYPKVAFDGSTYHMWYLGSPEQDNYALSQIGHATSTDGLSWTRDPANPVVTHDDGFVFMGTVLFDGATFRMWFSRNWAEIDYATSTDGSAWTEHPDPVLEPGSDGAWDDGQVAKPAVAFDGERYHMWYAGDTRVGGRIGYASSTDGISWSKCAGHGGPVMNPGYLAGAWDGDHLFAETVLISDGMARMWYNATDGARYGVGLATLDLDDVCNPPQHLNDNRFSTAVWWWDSRGGVGQGGPLKLTEDSNAFRFFSPENLEVVVKVLDGCAINGHYWVFAAGLTDVGLSLVVTDTVSGEVVSYSNTLGEAFQPVRDTAAFACE